MKAEIYPGADGWRFRVKGNNGEIMCVGEAYVRRIDAESALQQLFGIGQRMDVTVRNHGGEVVDSYQCGRVLQGRDEPTLDEVYGGQLDDVAKAYGDLTQDDPFPMNESEPPSPNAIVFDDDEYRGQ